MLISANGSTFLALTVLEEVTTFFLAKRTKLDAIHGTKIYMYIHVPLVLAVGVSVVAAVAAVEAVLVVELAGMAFLL